MTAASTRPQYSDIIGTVDAKGNVRFTDAFNKFLDDLIGGSNMLEGSVEALGARASFAQQLLNTGAPVVKVTALAYECTGREDVVVVTDGVQIKLPADPGRNKTVKVVKDTAEDLPIHGNGKPICGDTDVLVKSPRYSSLAFTYVLDADAWFIT